MKYNYQQTWSVDTLAYQIKIVKTPKDPYYTIYIIPGRADIVNGVYSFNAKYIDLALTLKEAKLKVKKWLKDNVRD